MINSALIWVLNLINTFFQDAFIIIMQTILVNYSEVPWLHLKAP